MTQGIKILQNTFIHIPGVGEKKEISFWENGILCWQDFMDNFDSIKAPLGVKQLVALSVQEYKKKNHLFFTPLLKTSEHWRAYHEFNDSCCYLDIETTGLDRRRNRITTIGLYDGNKSRVFVRGKDLHEFPDEFKKYSMVVTFNGIMFDIPFLKENFPDVDYNKLHLDLRFAMKKLGYSGGLKKIEKAVGISRPDEVDGVDGFEAVRLWRRYEKGDKKALDKLIKYNIEDIENLKTLSELTYDGLKELCFIKKKK